MSKAQTGNAKRGMVSKSSTYGRPTIIDCMGPKPPKLSGHRVVCTDECLYSFGGYAPENRSGRILLTELWQFHFFVRKWRKIPLKGTIPCEVASSAAVMTSGRTLILVGGTGIPFGARRNGDVYVCNLQRVDETGAVTWTRIPSKGDVPESRYGQAVAVHDNALYSVGGTDGHSYSIEVHRLDFHTCEWELLNVNDKVDSNLPATRYRHEIVVYNNKIFVFGGGTPHCVYGFDTIPAFDLTTRTWSDIPTKGLPSSSGQLVPLPRRCHSVVQSACGNWVILTGGVNEVDDMFDDVWKLELPTMRWHRFNFNLPQKVYFHSAAITSSGRMYIFGGVVDLRREQRTNELCAVDVDVPTLQGLCIDAAVSTAPRLSSLDSTGLLDVGIPYIFHSKIMDINNNDS